MASPFAVYRDLLRHAGVIPVDSLTELLEAAEVLSVLPAPKARGDSGGVSVFSIPGGTRAMTADALEQQGVPLSTFARVTVNALAAALPEFGGTENPTDLTGQVLTHPGLFNRCLELIADDPNTEALIVQVANRGPRDIMERLDLLGAVASRSRVPVIASFLGDAIPAADRLRLREHGVVCARDPVEAARFLGWVWRARAAQERQTGAPQRSPVPTLHPPREWGQTAEFLQACGIRVPGWRVLEADAEAVRVCSGLRFPVAVKALPEDADHKTELGLLRLSVSRDGLEDAVAEIRARLGSRAARVLVQEMDRGGVEVLLSAVHNPDFGPVLAIGSGGVSTELEADLAWIALPTTPDRVHAAIAPLKVSALLRGFRGRPAADIDALVNAACALGDRYLAAQPALRELELNPVFVHEHGSGEVVAVDALIKS
jgi:acyl-CoA synthetase (NDP forming)